jgi:hypothetical protein
MLKACLPDSRHEKTLGGAWIGSCGRDAVNFATLVSPAAYSKRTWLVF